MEPHRVRGQDKAVFHAGAGLRLVGELIVACHDQQTISRLQLRYLWRCDALDGSPLVIEGGEEILKAQRTVVARAEHLAQLLMASAFLRATLPIWSENPRVGGSIGPWPPFK